MRRGLVIVVLVIAFIAVAEAQKWKKYETRADTLLNREAYAEAFELYSKVIRSSRLKTRDAYNALYKRAVCGYYLQNYPSAIADLEKFIAKYPRIYQARLLRAFVLRETGDVDGQLNDLNIVLDQQPLDPDMMKWRASLYLEKEQFQEALEDLAYVESVANDAEVQVYKGYAFYGMQELNRALACMKDAIALDAAYLAPYLYSGSILLDQGEYETALTYLNLALRLDPENIAAMFYKGVALIELDRKEEGCSCLNKAFYAGEDAAADYLEEFCFSSHK